MAKIVGVGDRDKPGHDEADVDEPDPVHGERRRAFRAIADRDGRVLCVVDARYDAETDALYVRFSDGAVEEMRPGVMIDLDAEGRIIAIELLDASEHLAPGADLKALMAACSRRSIEGQTA